MPTAVSRRALLVAAAVSLVVLLLAVLGRAVPATASPTELFLSEYIEGSSNNKALEIFNGTGAPVNLAAGGYSIQMFFNGNPAAGLTIDLTGTVADGDVYVVAQASASAPILAQADQTSGAGWFNGDDAIALRKGTTVLDVIGQIGVDPGTEWGAGLTSTADNTLRRKPTIQVGDPNGADAFDPAVEWNGFATDTFDGLGSHSLSAGDAAPTVTSTTPAAGATGVPVDSNVAITFSENVDVTGSWFTIACGTSGSHSAAVSGGPQTFALDPASDFVPNETCAVTVVAANVTDQDTADPPDAMTADHVFSFSTPTPAVRIHDIQGAAHISPLNGQNVSGASGIVTALRTNGFYLQDPAPDGDDATSEGIFVFTSSAPAVAVGDALQVNGRVSEFRPGGAASTNLTTTELVTPSITVLSHGNALPGPTVIGIGGRIPPSEIIEDDATGDVETSGTFDPAGDGLDFYESLEGMYVQVNNAVAVGPTNSFGETQVVGDNGANASVRTARGGIVVRPNDFNPERLVLDDVIVGALPALNVGDHLPGAVVGPLDYNFGNFMLEVTSAPSPVHDGVTPETTTAAAANQLAIGTFNVENLDPTDPPAKFARLAAILVGNLKSPDVVTVEEVQDNTGPADDGVVDANVTLDMLVAAIQAAGGPTYSYRQINPVNDQDGGEPGGNIRQVFLFRTDRGVSFVDRPGGGSTTATTVVSGPDGPELSSSPGRLDPTNGAFTTSRKPLAGEFLYRGHRLFVIGNHWNSKGGDQALSGHFQPPTRGSEVQRRAQAVVVRDFVASILAANPSANVVVDGDLNDFEFSDAVTTVKAAGLADLIESLPQNERYSYVFEGNSQSLDHVLVSSALSGRPIDFDEVHVNAEFADQASDHDPSVARITLDDAPTVSAGGPYAVAEGGTAPLAATGQDPEGSALTYAWDLDGNGTFETPGQSVSFSADDGPATRTVRARTTDEGGLTGTAETTVTIENVAPTATFVAPASVFAGFAVPLALTSPHDPSAADTAAGFTYAFDCGDGSGYGAFAASPSASCPTTDTGARAVGAKIRDKDGGVTEYRGTVQVRVTFDSLCSLTRSYSSSRVVADVLCATLRAAAAARTTLARNLLLAAYRVGVDLETGRAFTPAEAVVLKRLSMRL